MQDAITNLDCIAGMADIPDDSVDLVVTDPPFAINHRAAKANYNRTGSRVLEGYAEITPEEYPAFTKSWLAQAYRVLKPSGSIYVFSGWNHLGTILNVLDEVGFHRTNQIIWKYQFGVATKNRFVSSHYTCPYACKDPARRRFYPSSRYAQQDRDGQGRSLRYRDMEDVWVIKKEYWHGTTKTPTKLPAAIIAKMLAYSSLPGDVVLDPFLGSGQVAVVSKMMNRRYLGFEVVPEYYRFARSRLDDNVYHPGGPG